MNKKKTMYLVIVFSIGIVAFNSCSKDEDCTEQTWYQDSDEDGFGNPNNSQESCTQPAGYISDNSDFDDVNATAFPGADEICDDGIDNNGNGEIDECSVPNQTSGSWTDNFNGSYTITNASISVITANGSSYLYHILANGSNYVICLNDSTNPFYADLYSKFVFTNIATNEFNLCQPFYNEPSQASIENSNDPTNPNDLDTGCGGFVWSLLTRN